jgi:hypothetical protein
LPGDASAAFVLLKRGKELVWIAVGYVLLAMLRRPAVQSAVPAAGSAASARLQRA